MNGTGLLTLSRYKCCVLVYVVFDQLININCGYSGYTWGTVKNTEQIPIFTSIENRFLYFFALPQDGRAPEMFLTQPHLSYGNSHLRWAQLCVYLLFSLMAIWRSIDRSNRSIRKFDQVCSLFSCFANPPPIHVHIYIFFFSMNMI